MKKFKKLLAFGLALIMCLGMAVTVSAATITVANPQEKNAAGENVTYEAFKIFSLVKSTDGKNYSYTLDGTSEVYTQLSGLLTGEITSYTGYGIRLEKTTVSGVYNAEVTDAPVFAAYLKNLGLTGGIAGTKSGDTVQINVGDSLGYYFISTNSGTLADLTTVDDQLTVYDKNEKPTIKKESDVVEADKDSVEVGQVITYTITGKVPSTTGYSKYKYIVKDQMSEGLTFKADSVLNTLDATVSAVQDQNGFILEFDMTKYSDKVGEEFTVTYTAVVNDRAITQNNETNSATVDYSNNPQNPEETGTTPPVVVEVYTASVIIEKYEGNPDDADDHDIKLAGAEFVLTKVENGVTSYYKYIPAKAAVDADPDNGVDASPAVEAKVEWVSAEADATHVTTDDNGAAKFDGLKAGTYYLVETKAPTGYNLLNKPVEVTVTEGVESDTTHLLEKVNAAAPVANYTGTVLPSTGGIGTTIFYVVGGLLVAGAGIVLITKKRMKKEQ